MIRDLEATRQSPSFSLFVRSCKMLKAAAASPCYSASSFASTPTCNRTADYTDDKKVLQQLVAVIRFSATLSLSFLSLQLLSLLLGPMWRCRLSNYSTFSKPLSTMTIIVPSFTSIAETLVSLWCNVKSTPSAHLDEVGGLELNHLLAQDWLLLDGKNTREQDGHESCCLRANIICRTKARLLLHSMPENLASYLQQQQQHQPQAQQQEVVVQVVLEPKQQSTTCRLCVATRVTLARVHSC
jgi:hypothetical protein